MHHAKTRKAKIGLLLQILWPILVTQISYNAMSLFDTIMSGRAGLNDLAGVAIGSSLWLPVYIGLNGILLAVTPIIGHLLGSGKRGHISESVTQALYLSVVLAIAVTAVGAVILDPVLSLMEPEPEVYHIAKHYLIGLAFGIVPLFASNVIRNFFDAQGFTKITMLIMLIAVPFNIILNYLLIFGKMGFPELGGIGAGYATAATYWLILLISIWMTFRLEVTKPYRLFVRWFVPSMKAWAEQLKIGIPMGLSIFFEASIFSAVTLWMGMMFDTATVAAHQAAISFTTLLFMFPLSISMALTIIVAYEAGAGRSADAKQYGRIGVASAIGILAVCSVLLFIFREQIALFYTDEPEVIELVKQFFIFAIFYQLSDGAQASLQGVLRGYKDVTIPFITALIAYWAIGIPSGYLMAAYTRFGPYGFWLGITVGLTCAAIGFYLRLRIVTRRRERNMAT
ncbi:MATE family efflux transporter [Marinicrinis lubricantis]|uniref:Probable multidrug resistance protein NorM n=1 Tax=Marinicrinis lubricantis TaxID=2086470 RepID=A0ABW1IQS6_9BACL